MQPLSDGVNHRLKKSMEVLVGMTLKELLGDKFDKDLTLAQVDELLEGKKLVDLNGAVKYVVKDKFDKLNEELEQIKNSTKDYEVISKELTALKTEKENVVLKDTLMQAGVNEKFVDDLLYRVEKGVIKKDDKLLDNVKSFLKDNPHYAKVEQSANAQPANQPTPVATRIFSTSANATSITDAQAPQQKNSNNVTINENIRNIIAGRK